MTVGALRSARVLAPLLVQKLNPTSLLDVGCGQGAWLAAWRQSGVEDVFGMDGDYVDRERLLIPRDRFQPYDLSQPFSPERRFDLVQSLEVAEHLPETSAAGFVESLVKHSDLVLFSAAAEGQGGNDHINEQSYDYWRAHFSRHGYVALDCIRPLIAGVAEVEPWYRYNSFLYASPEGLSRLPDDLKAQAVSDDQNLTDVSPPLYRARKAVIRLLPTAAVTRLAKLNERIAVATRSN